MSCYEKGLISLLSLIKQGKCSRREWAFPGGVMTIENIYFGVGSSCFKHYQFLHDCLVKFDCFYQKKKRHLTQGPTQSLLVFH